MFVQRVVPVLVVLLALLAWRQSRIVKSVMLPVELPPAYYYDGDASTQCSRITDPTGELKYCEDEVFWDVNDADGNLLTRRLILSCDTGRREWNTVMGPLKNPDPLGALWLVAYNGGSDPFYLPQKITLKDYSPRKDFHPLGIDISPSVGGNSSNLFVINLGRRFNTVEQFTLHPDDPTTAHFVRTIKSKDYVSPNSITLTSATSYYVSNTRRFTRRLPFFLGSILPMIETVLAVPLGFMLHVNLKYSIQGSGVFEYKHPARSLPFPNGIAVSPDGMKVAVGSSSMAMIYMYDRNTTTNILTAESHIPLSFAPDNVAFDDTGALLVAGHPFFPALTKHADGRAATSPSWVVAIRRLPDGSPPQTVYDQKAILPASSRAPEVKGYEVETLYQSDGTHFSASTTALRDSVSGSLFITGLYETGILVCKS